MDNNAGASLRNLLAATQPKVGQTRLIAIDGHGGSGKSTIANKLARILDAGIVHTDDFASWDNPLNWWPLVIERVFEPIANGAASLSHPRSKWWESHNPEPVVDQPVTKIMILEGVGSLRKEFRDYISFGIFVDTPKSVCLQRGIERDRATGKTEEELIRIWERWFQDEESYIAHDRPQEYADLVIDGTRPYDEQLKFSQA